MDSSFFLITVMLTLVEGRPLEKGKQFVCQTKSTVIKYSRIIKTDDV